MGRRGKELLAVARALRAEAAKLESMASADQQRKGALEAVEEAWATGGAPAFVHFPEGCSAHMARSPELDEEEGGPVQTPWGGGFAFPSKAVNERARDEAARNGCRPHWNDDYERWCCGCRDGRHCGDSQCSVITTKSARG